MGAYCRTHGTSEHVSPETGEPMDCDRAQQIRARLTAHTPTAQESATFWADVPIEQEWPVVDATDGQEVVSGVGVAVDTSERCEAVRSPRVKPYVKRWPDSAGYRAVLACCPFEHEDGSIAYPSRWRESWPEALAAALAHVAEHHTPKPDAATERLRAVLLAASEAAELAQKPQEDAFWERHYADAEADVAAFNLECRQHTEPVGNPDKPRTITVTPDQLEAVTRIFDAFGVEYATDDALDVNPFPPDPDHLSQVADALTTLTANRRALDDAHRLGGCRD